MSHLSASHHSEDPQVADPQAASPDAVPVTVTVLGGPTVLLEIAGLRLLTDPTFDPPGEHRVGTRVLVKTEPSVWTPGQVGAVDAVLLSHDQHPDNLDDAGRVLLTRVPRVFTTPLAAERLAGNAVGLAPWSSIELPRPDGGFVRLTAVPAQHGPDGTEHLTGPVTGFVISADGLPAIYISGDNASLDVVRSVSQRFPDLHRAVLFAGGARTPLLGDAYLTLSSAMAAEATQLLGRPRVVVAHTDGWAHFTESRADVTAAFTAAGLAQTLVATRPGETVPF